MDFGVTVGGGRETIIRLGNLYTFVIVVFLGQRLCAAPIQDFVFVVIARGHEADFIDRAILNNIYIYIYICWMISKLMTKLV